MADFSVRRSVSHRAPFLVPGLRRQVFSAAEGMTDIIRLGRGDPDFDTPAHIREAAKAALDAQCTHYTPWTGIPALRQAVATKLRRDNGLDMDPDSEIVITNGAQEAVFMIMQVLLDPGDEVLVVDPHYSAYDTGIRVAGGVVVPVPTKADDGFAVQSEVLESHVSPRTRLLVLVNPNNPTGTMISRDTALRISEIVDRHDLIVVSDEVYEKLVYSDSPPHVTFASLPGMRQRTITINSLSKTYAMTGWRLGYLAGPRDLVGLLAELKYNISICATAVSQAAGVAALNGPQEHLVEMILTLDERRGFLVAALNAMGLPTLNPQAAFTVLPGIQHTGMSSLEFCTYVLREARVQIFPGIMYGPSGEGHVRINFLAPLPVLQEAVERLATAVGRL